MNVSIREKALAALLGKEPEKLETVADELFNLLLNGNNDLRKLFADVVLAMPDHLRPTIEEFENQAVATFVNHADALPDKEREEAYREAVRQAPPGSKLEKQAKKKLTGLEPTRQSEMAAPVPSP